MRELFVVVLFFIGVKGFGETSNFTKYIKENAIRMDNLNLPSSIVEKFKDKKLILFGEGHGTNEMPQQFLRAVEAISKLKPIVVGLEFPRDIQPQIEEFFESGDLADLKKISFFQEPNFHSGRASTAMMELLKDLRKLKNVKPFCFDVPIEPTEPGNREMLMAKSVAKKLRDSSTDPVFVLTGNVHSRLSHGVPWDPNFKTMGAMVKEMSPQLSSTEISNVLFRFEKGTAWQCRIVNGAHKCEKFDVKYFRPKYSSAVDYSHYFLEEKKLTSGHQNVWFIRNVSASFPWLENGP